MCAGSLTKVLPRSDKILCVKSIFSGRNIGVLVSLLLIVLSSLVHLYIVIINDFPPAPLLTAKLQM